MKQILKILLSKSTQTLSTGWKPYSRLILTGDNIGWSLDWDMRELRRISGRLGIQTVSNTWKSTANPQALFFASQFFFDNDDWLFLPHKIGFSYFHGLPGTGYRGFDDVYSALCKHHQRIERIQVTHTEMREAVLRTGIRPNKVHLIPIGINLDFFSFRNTELRQKQRKRLDIPPDAFVIGSFQKDGNGWGEGLEPKLIKGPDIFVKTVALLRESIPNLMVLLTGPARGYVKAGLEKLNVPYRHVFLKDYPEVGKLFSALDLYLVTSRQEGGPKAVLESMASGVPLVTTRVGQAMDIVKHGENGWMVAVEDVDGLAKWAKYVYDNRGLLDNILKTGRATAEANAYTAQLPLWRNFMKGFVEWEE